MIEKFIETEAKATFKEYLEEIEQIYQDEKEEISYKFQREMAQILNAINSKVWLDDEKPAFMYLNLLKTNILQRKYSYPVYIYDKELYMKDGWKVGEIGFEYLFRSWDSVWKNLLQESRKYVGKISAGDVERLMLSKLSLVHRYVVEIMRHEMVELSESVEYMAMPKDNWFEIGSGEYFEPVDLLYVDNCEKDEAILKKQIKTGVKQELLFQDYRKLELSGEKLNNRDIRYADFRDSAMNRTQFYACLLDGAKFKRGKLKESNFMLSLINDVNFEEADLEGAFFGLCIADQGKNSQNEWRKVGYRGTNFRNSNLEKADFQKALLIGADFRGARIKGANFERACLKKSIFDKKQLTELNLTEEQMKEVIICR